MTIAETQENQTVQNDDASKTVEDQQPANPVRRGRGRPPKDANAAGAAPKKESVSGSNSKAKKSAKSIGGVSGEQLMGIHQMLYVFTGQQYPEIQLASPEAQMLADSINGVCEQYDLSIDGKTGAFLQLAGTAAMIYAPRYLAIRARMAQAQPVDVQSKEVPSTQ